MRYAVVIETAGNIISACVPDLPGCVTTGSSLEEVEEQIRQAIEFHLEGLRADNLPIPPASSRVDYVEVAARQIVYGLLGPRHDFCKTMIVAGKTHASYCCQ